MRTQLLAWPCFPDTLSSPPGTALGMLGRQGREWCVPDLKPGSLLTSHYSNRPRTTSPEGHRPLRPSAENLTQVSSRFTTQLSHSHEAPGELPDSWVLALRWEPKPCQAASAERAAQLNPHCYTPRNVLPNPGTHKNSLPQGQGQQNFNKTSASPNQSGQRGQQEAPDCVLQGVPHLTGSPMLSLMGLSGCSDSRAYLKVRPSCLPRVDVPLKLMLI